MQKQNWIIAISNSEGDGVELQYFEGTKSETKKLLLKIAEKDKALDEESFDYGPECLDDIEENLDTLYTSSTYSNYHIDYTAKVLETIKRV